KWKVKVVLILNYKARKRHGKIVAQSLFRNRLTKGIGILLLKSSFIRFLNEIARVQYFKNQSISLLTVFPGKGRKVFHGRSFDRQKAVFAKNILENAQDVLTLLHSLGQQIACTFWQARFYRHNIFDIICEAQN